MHFDYVVVGAGFTGATLAERLATTKNAKVLVVERRDHIGGNAYDEYNEHGILVHRYGPHIFHTNSDKVWQYLSKFTEWRPYQHRVLGNIEGKLVPIPFNLDSLHQLFPAAMAERLEDKLVSYYGFGSKVPILKLRQTKDEELQYLANYVYKNVFEGYTRKQWGLDPEQLAPSVTARVPILISRDDRYFQDTYQAMPKYGYTALFRNMLAHPNIHLLLNTDYKEVFSDITCTGTYHTGPIDEYFNYIHGQLPYRSLRFEWSTQPEEQVQTVGTINYPTQYDFTRITEQKHLTGQSNPFSTLIREFPETYEPGQNDPYYPIPRDETRGIYAKYKEEMKRLEGNVYFCGRLGDYQYYNMDQAVARALTIAENNSGLD